MLLNLTKPTERTIDLLHANFIRRIEEGSDTLIKFGLERLDPRFVARKTYKPPTPEEERLEKCTLGFIEFLERETIDAADLPQWYELFAKHGGVDAKQLEPSVKKKLGAPDTHRKRHNLPGLEFGNGNP